MGRAWVNRSDLRAALSHPNVAGFLRVIRQGESSQDEAAYSIQYGGKHFAAPPWAHPREKVTAGRWTSTAAGAYQFLAGTWDGLVARYQFPDFSPGCQDMAAVALIHGRKALDDVQAGRFEAAIAKCGKEWASLPGSPYGQPVMTMEEARSVYERWGGRYVAPAASTAAFNPDTLDTEHYEGLEPNVHTPQAKAKEAPMAFPLIPLITAFGPQLLQLIPQLGALFGSGSDVQVRNVQAATLAVDAIVKATDSPNLQAAIERMQDDPEAARAARGAVAEVMALVEVGGGIVEARKAAAAYADSEWWRMLAVPQTWIALLLLGLVYIAMGNVTGLFGFQGWTPEIRSNIVFAVVGVAIGSVSGFYFGTSQGSQRKTDILAGKE